MITTVRSILKDFFQFITRNDSFRRWYPNFTIRGMRKTILTRLKSACDEDAWQAFEEYSRNRDINKNRLKTFFRSNQSIVVHVSY